MPLSAVTSQSGLAGELRGGPGTEKMAWASLGQGFYPVWIPGKWELFSLIMWLQ